MRSQRHYELGERLPDAAYLAKALAMEIDVLYVLAGRRSFEPPQTLLPDEHMVIAGYRLLDARGKAGVLGLIGGITSPADLKKKEAQPVSQSNVMFAGPVTQTAGKFVNRVVGGHLGNMNFGSAEDVAESKGANKNKAAAKASKKGRER